MRELLQIDPFIIAPPEDLDANPNWHTGTWPAHWITHPACDQPPFVTAYRCVFEVSKAASVRIHITADERYILYLDGKRIGRGSERGDRMNWFYESYRLDLAPGEHALTALVWTLGDGAPLAQFNIRSGFILACDDPAWNAVLGTGIGTWQVQQIHGYRFEKNRAGFGVGDCTVIDGSSFSWNYFQGAGKWVTPTVGEVGFASGSYDKHGQISKDQRLRLAMLPAMMEEPWTKGQVRFITGEVEGLMLPDKGKDISSEHDQWTGVIQGISPVVIPPNTGRRVLIDLEDYVCAYTHVVTSGGKGASIKVSWTESLYEGDITEWWHVYHKLKGNRDEIWGKTYVGEGDTFLPDGGNQRVFENLWWKSGRYIEVVITTTDDPLTLDRLVFLETRYPLEADVKFKASDPRFERTWPVMTRVLQMCSHETYMDCPYYEQLMYVGDTRLEVLVTYSLTHDDRLPRKAIEMFDVSRYPEGLTQSRYPSRKTQIIPPFSLWWCGMVYDHARYRGNRKYIQAKMIGVHAVLDAFWSYRNAQGVVEGPHGWNYADWTRAPGWHRGTPPQGESGMSGIHNWHFAWTLTQVAELEAWLGEPESAARYRRYAQSIADAAMHVFWDAERGLFADDATHEHFSEHSQCLALLSGLLDEATTARVANGLLNDPELVLATIYWSHYLFETYYHLGRVDKLFDRLPEWFELVDLGFKTTREAPEPSRSDCHAWGAHPIYHSYASILGIRPAGFGFDEIVIAPQLGDLSAVQAELVHPKGEIAVNWQVNPAGQLNGTITLPADTKGTLTFNGREHILHAGEQTIEV